MMKKVKIAIAVLTLFFCFHVSAHAQELLSSLPTTKEEFIASEKNVLATIDWLENTPVDTGQEKRKTQEALLVAWITNSPTVTLEISAGVLTFTKKNPGLMVLFMGGWVRYALQNNYSQDATKGSLAGIRSAIKVYRTGLLKKDKEMEKLLALEEKGELEDWVKSKLVK